MNRSGDATAPPHVRLEHCPGIGADPSSTLETDVMTKQVDNVVSVLVGVPDYVVMSLLAFHLGLVSSRLGLGVMGMAHFCLQSAQFMRDVFLGSLYPLPGLQHVVVNAFHHVLEGVVGLGKLMICGMLFETLFGKVVCFFVAFPLGLRVALF